MKIPFEPRSNKSSPGGPSTRCWVDSRIWRGAAGQGGESSTQVLSDYISSVNEALDEALGDLPSIPLPSDASIPPLVTQQVNYSCGDVASLSLLRFWDPADYANTPEEALYRPMETTPEDGTEPPAIEKYFNGVPGLSGRFVSFERRARRHHGGRGPRAAADRGHPSVARGRFARAAPTVGVKEWDFGHYVVLTGYDDANFYFMDLDGSLPRYAYIPRDEFMDRWHDVLGKGDAAQQVQHMAIFVQPTSASLAPTPAASPVGTATAMY